MSAMISTNFTKNNQEINLDCIQKSHNFESQVATRKSDSFEMKFVPYASLCFENYLDQFLILI